MSAFLGPDQAATEERLIADPDCRPWVEKYQRSRDTVSRTDYEVSYYISIFLNWQCRKVMHLLYLCFCMTGWPDNHAHEAELPWSEDKLRGVHVP